jgi:two-component system chemotaxis response regulator CheB
MEAGALAVLKKPMGIGHPEHEANAKELIQTVKLMSEIKPVRRWPSRALEVRAAKAMPGTPLPKTQKQINVVAIGASTGGPPVIEAILSGLPEDFPVPLLIVQHMAAGFTTGFVEWLDRTSALPVHVATDGIRILPGQAYVAPDGVQMKVEMGGKISLINDPPEHGLRPSVSYTFRSVTKAFGVNAVGVLLTGIGEDGAKELKLMKDNGAITIAQDKESSVVFGMPGKAVDLDAAMYVLPPNMIVATLIRLANRNQLV